VKAKIIVNQQTKKQMCDFSVQTIKKLQGGDSGSQAPIDINGPLHSN
jgi:hypothetical protein